HLYQHSFPTRRSSDLAKSSIPENFTSHSKRLDLLRDELNQYVENLHEKQSCGFSLFELFNAYSGCKKGSDHVPFDTENLKTLNRSEEHTSELQSRENL